LTAAGTELAATERALAQLPGGPGTVAEMNAALPGLQRRITTAATAAEGAKVELTAAPAKVLATQLDPGCTAARPRLVRRGRLMALRLLAFNAEAWLAEHFNAYLVDAYEYRAILRHLIQLGRQVDYSATGDPLVTWTAPTGHGWPVLWNCWPRSSTPRRRAFPVTGARSAWRGRGTVSFKSEPRPTCGNLRLSCTRSMPERMVPIDESP